MTVHVEESRSRFLQEGSINVWKAHKYYHFPNLKSISSHKTFMSISPNSVPINEFSSDVSKVVQ